MTSLSYVCICMCRKYIHVSTYIYIYIYLFSYIMYILYILGSAPKKDVLGRPFLNQRVETFTTVADRGRDPMYFQKGVSRLHIFKCFLS